MAERGALLKVRGGDRARPRLARPMAMFGSDPDVMYVLGERDDDVVLESWSADTGVRVGSVVVARCAQLRCDTAWRADRPDTVVIALRGMDRNEVALLDLRTGSVWDERTLGYGGRLVATSRDGGARAEQPSDPMTRAFSIARDGGYSAYLEGVDRVAISPDGRLVAQWVGDDHVVVVSELSGGAVIGSSEADAGLIAPRLSFSDEATTLWAAGAGVLCAWALPSMEPLGRWADAPRDAEIVALGAAGRAALLDGPIAYAVGTSERAAVRAFRWRACLARVSPDGSRLARASRVLGWHDLTSDRRMELHAHGHAGAVRSVAVSLDGSLVATAGDDPVIRVWDAASGEGRWELEGAASGYDALAFAPGMEALYARSSTESLLTSWSLTEGIETTPCRMAMTYSDAGIEVSADARWLLHRQVAAHDAARERVDLERFESRWEEPISEYDTDPDVAGWGTCNSFDHTHVLDVEYEHEGFVRVTIYEVGMRAGDAPSIETTLRAPASAYTMGNALVALGSVDGVIALIDRTTREVTYLTDPLRTPVTALTFSPDESRLYAGTGNGQVRVYQT